MTPYYRSRMRFLRMEESADVKRSSSCVQRISSDQSPRTMDSAYWERVQALFGAALDRPKDDRAAFLDAACPDDDALRRDVLSLLEADATAHSFLDGVALDAVNLSDAFALDGQQIGPYRIIREIGQGGMGAVYLAERADGQFEQQVALKLIKRGMDSELILRRFEHERQILARLQHPNIARLLGGGLTEDGRPYFAMEYVDGAPIDTYCDARQLSIDERLGLFTTVCKAVLYAHAKLVVHRDLKPENILVTQDEAGQPQVKLLDFGIAKLLEDPSEGLTRTGMAVMTPAYASPEQVRGEVVSTSTDIYSLGVVLYELLTGVRPYDVASQSSDAAQAIATVEPVRPSTVVKMATATDRRVSQARGTQPGRLRRRLTGDLDVICLKALRKEPERRYGSVEAFADDLQRHRDGLPVLARSDAVSYRLRKFVLRHRTGVSIAAAAVLVVMTLVGYYTARLAQERDLAQREAAKAQQVAGFLESIFETTDPSEARGETVTARELLDAGHARIAEDLQGQPLVRAPLLRTLGNVYRELGLFEEARPLLEEAVALHRAAHGLRHPETASSQTALALVLDEIGEREAAEALYREALVTRRAVLGPDHPLLSESLANLGYLLQNQGLDTEAEVLLREALTIDRLHFAADHPYVATSMTRLARLLRQEERYDEAETLLREALAAQRRHYAGDHPEVASTLRNLASLLRDTDRYEEAEVLYRETIAMRRRLYGDLHAEVGVALNSYAQLLRYQERLEQATAVTREYIAIAEHTYGPVHPEPAIGYYNLGLILRDAGDLRGAQRAFEQTLAIEDDVLGPEHPDRAYTLLELADLYRQHGAASDALPLLDEAIAIRQKHYGADDDRTTEVTQMLQQVRQSLTEPPGR
jgi:serine/threonine-protein kinase